MDNYDVVVYDHIDRKSFAVTARKPGATLNKMNKHMKEVGFDVLQVGTGLSEETANGLKKALVEERKGRGKKEVSMAAHIGHHFGPSKAGKRAAATVL